MATSVEDMKMIESYRAGDQAVFAELVRAYQPALMRHAMRRLHDQGAAEDAVQETFVRAYRAMARVDDDYRLGPWLHRILANVCIDEGNRRRREAEKFARVSRDPRESRPVASGVEDELGLELDHSALRAAFDDLPDSYRQALSLRYVSDLTYDEVAQLSGVSQQNARARVSRACTAMRHALKGVAVLPFLLAMSLVRKGGRRAAVSALASGSSSTGTAAATGTALPFLSKAVIGLGFVAAATAPNASFEMSDRVQPPQPNQRAIQVTPSPSVAPVTTLADPQAQVPSVQAATPAAQAPAPEAAAIQLSEAMSPTAAVTVAVPVLSTPAVPATVPATTPATSPPATVPPTVPVTTVPPTTPPPAPSQGGSLSVSSLTVSPSGPRLDISGALSIMVGDQSRSGSLSGRLSLGDADASGQQRLDGVLTLALDDGSSIEVRLAGYATGSGDDGSGSFTSYAMSGVFRAGANALSLAESGSFSGSFAATSGGAMSLSLTN